jgi:hypothetical protein
MTTDWENGVRSPAEAKNVSSSFCFQTGSEVHPASYPLGTGSPFPGGNAQQGQDSDYSPHLVPRSRMSTNSTSSPPCCLHVCSGIALNFFIRPQCSFTFYKKTLRNFRYFSMLTSSMHHFITLLSVGWKVWEGKQGKGKT